MAMGPVAKRIPASELPECCSALPAPPGGREASVVPYSPHSRSGQQPVSLETPTSLSPWGLPGCPSDSLLSLWICHLFHPNPGLAVSGRMGEGRAQGPINSALTPSLCAVA